MGIQELPPSTPPQPSPSNPFGIRGGDPNARTIAGLKLLRTRGIVNDSADPPAIGATIPPEVAELIPASVAREHVIMPLRFDGETITVAAVNADDIALADKLRFITAKNIKLV